MSCEHKKILYLGKNTAYCRECKTKVDLDPQWSRQYKATTKVDEYEKK